jgi:hypothetical protein
VFLLRITEKPMPTGSKDSGVLLDWLLESMGLIRRRPGVNSGDNLEGSLHRIFTDALLKDPLRGWDSRELGDHTGLSNTGIHHQMVKLRQCGLVAAQVDGKWHRNILRGGSISAAVRLVESQALAILELRLLDLSQMVEQSETRMETDSEDAIDKFSIRIAEPGPNEEGVDRVTSLSRDLGLAGDSHREGDTIAGEILSELCSCHIPVTLMALSERISQSRGRVSTVIERMRSARLVDRVPMVDRIHQDIFSGLIRQSDARGEEWLMGRGGLGRLESQVSGKLLEGIRKDSLNIEAVREILTPVSLGDQRVLLNTLGGRMPYGVRISGTSGSEVSRSVMSRAERALRRMRTVAERLEDALSG